MNPPPIKDFHYGPAARQVLDVYHAPGPGTHPAVLYLHPGGFAGGNKESLPLMLRDGCLHAGITVVAANYRLTDEVAYPVPHQDCALALQTMRDRAAEWNIDPTRIAAAGGSAGAGIAMWLAFRHESGGLLGVDVWNGQCTYDPNWIRENIAGPAYVHTAMQNLFRVTPEQFNDPRARADFADCAAITHLKNDAPPVFAWYWIPDHPMTPELSSSDGIHHPLFGKVLKQKMDALGCQCTLRLREDFPELSKEPFIARLHAEGVAFLVKVLAPKAALKVTAR